MKEAKYIFKCRNCGKVFDNGTRGNKIIMRTDFFALMATGETLSKHAFSPSMIDIHSCNKRITGVADLIGFEE